MVPIHIPYTDLPHLCFPVDHPHHHHHRHHHPITYPRLQHCLNLFLGASSDVANGPACFLFDALLVTGGEQVEQAWEGIAIDHHLGLQIIPRDNVADRAKGRDQHGCGLMPVMMVW